MHDQNLWDGVLASLSKVVDAKMIDTWISSAKIYSNRGNGITIVVKNKFFKTWVEKNYLTQIAAILKDEYDIDVPVNITFNTQEVAPVEQAKVAEQPEVMQPKQEPGSMLYSEYTFESFVDGDSNSFAHAAALAVADGNFSIYNPLYIYGGTGLGKTHLMHAISNRIKKKFPKMKILYMDSETFSTEIINVFSKKESEREHLQERIEKMKERFLSADLFMLDDIQFMKNREKSLEFFFNIFNGFQVRQKQVVITSDESPQEINMAERMRSRFASGFQAEILPPTVEERVNILQNKAHELGMPVSDHIAMYLADNIATSNNRELIASLKRVHLYSSIDKVPISEELVNKALGSVGLLKKTNIIVSPQQLITVVSETFNVKLSDMVSKKKTKSIVHPRQVAMYLLRERLKLSLKEIGSHFGNRDHSTVKYAIESIKKQMETDEFLCSIISKIEKNTFV